MTDTMTIKVYNNMLMSLKSYDGMTPEGQETTQ